MITVFLTPLSVLASDILKDLSINLSLPSEPLLIGLSLIFLLKMLTGQHIDKRILTHPVSVLIFIHLLWLIITSFTSTMPIVSLKFVIARMWFIIPLYFLAAQFFRDQKFIKKYLWAYIISFSCIIVYNLYNHISLGLFIKNAAHSSMRPFYNDHTSYGAVIAMFIPVIISFLLIKKKSKFLQVILIALLLFFSIALIFSFSRAAWLSVILILLVYVVIIFKVNRYILLGGSIAVVTIFFVFQFEITERLTKNRQDSSGDLTEHVQSVSNIATDASNLERINRWNSAFRMFEERPILGFGPGTYMFQYAPYQMSYEKTIISTNFADGGNAHSEYIGPLAESGILGTLSFIAIIIATVIYGIRSYYFVNSRKIKMLILGVLPGLITYYIHGFLNNFLDTDKASVPFWGFTAIIVAVDVFYRKKEPV